jgi:hypothetical protein
MPIVSRLRPRIGDVIEIPTPRGLAYAHYTHRHTEPPCYGSLLRVMPGLYQERPTDFSVIVRLNPIFTSFFPLGAACNRKIVRVVASESISMQNNEFPIFRNSLSDSGPWWLWDGKKEWRVRTLSPQQLKDYPPLGVWTDILLVERIMQDWRHEHDRAPITPSVAV